jgi:hypothetical protein
MTIGNKNKLAKLIKSAGIFHEGFGEYRATIAGCDLSAVYVGANGSEGDYIIAVDKPQVESGSQVAFTHKVSGAMLERVSLWNSNDMAIFRRPSRDNSAFMLKREEVEAGWV